MTLEHEGWGVMIVPPLKVHLLTAVSNLAFYIHFHCTLSIQKMEV